MAEPGRRTWDVLEGGRGRPAPVLEALDRLIAESTPEERPALVVQLSARLAQLGAGLTATPEAGPPGESPDRNLSARETARRLGVSLPYLYKHADDYPFTVRMGTRVLFSARGLAKWTRQKMNESP